MTQAQVTVTMYRMKEAERVLDLSEGAQHTSKVTFSVPETESRGEIIYLVEVERDPLLSSVTTGKLREFMEDVEKKVLEDVKKNEENNT